MKPDKMRKAEHLASLKKNLWQEWCTETSWHGMRQIMQAKWKITRIFWILLVAFCSLQIVYQVAIFFNDFLYGRNWVTRIAYEKHKHGISMPNITVCNFHNYNLTQLETFSLTFQEFIFIYDSIRLVTDAEYTSTLAGIGMENLTLIYENVREKVMEETGTVEALLEPFVKTCEETFLACRWPGEKDFFDCCSYVSTAASMGKVCHTLVLPGNDPSKKGPVTRDLGQKARILLDPAVQHSSQTIGEFVGFKVHLNFAGSDMFLTHDPLILSPGTMNWVYMHLEQYSLLEAKGVYSVFSSAKKPCMENGKLQFYRGAYSYQACSQDCILKYYIQKCRCNPDHATETYPKCGPLDIYQCEIDYQASNTSQTDATFDNCMKKCQQPCERIVVRSRQISAVLGAKRQEAFENWLNWLLRGKYLDPRSKENLIALELGLDRMEVRTVETVRRVTGEAFISSIGGVMGVWAGMSIITLMEATTFLAYGLCRLFNVSPK